MSLQLFFGSIFLKTTSVCDPRGWVCHCETIAQHLQHQKHQTMPARGPPDWSRCFAVLGEAIRSASWVEVFELCCYPTGRQLKLSVKLVVNGKYIFPTCCLLALHYVPFTLFWGEVGVARGLGEIGRLKSLLSIEVRTGKRMSNILLVRWSHWYWSKIVFVSSWSFHVSFFFH